MRILPVLLSTMLAAPAFAGTVDSPACRADLPKASALISSVAARDNAGPVRDTAKRCEILRLNRREMNDAARILDRCLTGHERQENVVQLRVSVSDVDAVLARKCR